MASPDFPEPPPSVPATPIAECDAMLETLNKNAAAWVQTTPAQRISLLKETIDAAVAESEAWVDAACAAKGIPAGSNLRGEEYLAGPMTFIRNLRLLIESMEAGGQPKLPGVSQRPDGQFIAEVFPTNTLDKIMYGGMTAQIWVKKGEQPTQGQIYRDKQAGNPTEGRIGLVLGAGNVASIGPMDALYKLFVDDEVVILKTNPVNAYLGPFIERSFKPFADRGWFALCHGGAEVGAHLCNHDLVHSIHITGSDKTHDAIVFGSDPKERAKNMANNTPVNTKPISSELGAVTPVLVVPGPWSESDLDFQARHVASMVTNNGSFNCNAAKVLVTAKGWSLRARFVEKVHAALANMPRRKAYYPGAQQRYEGFLENYPQAKAIGNDGPEVVPWTVIPDVAPKKGEYALTNEAFCGVLAETTLEATTAEEFIQEMVRFGNDEAWGTLSCMVLIHPETEKQNKAAFEEAIAELRYGGIAINTWAGVIYGLVTPSWGAYPGHSLTDIQSGRGVVHNTFMIDHVEKSVVRAPFRIKPTPAWFGDHKTLPQLGRALVKFEATGGLGQLPAVIWAAMRG